MQRLQSNMSTIDILLYIYIVLIIILDFRSVLVWQLTCKQTLRPFIQLLILRWSAATLKQVTGEGNKLVVSAKSNLGSWCYFDQATRRKADDIQHLRTQTTEFNFISIDPNHNRSRLRCFMNLICELLEAEKWKSLWGRVSQLSLAAVKGPVN